MQAEFTVPHNQVCMQLVLLLIHVNSIMFSTSSVFFVFSQALTTYQSVSQTYISYGHPLALKINHGSSHSCSVEPL